MTIEARREMAAGTASSRMRSTSNRLARWREGGAPAGTSPPRYTMRWTPAARAAAAKRSAERRSRSTKVPSPVGAASIEWMRK